MDEADARARIANQVSREQRLAVADVVIDNSGTLEDARSPASPRSGPGWRSVGPRRPPTPPRPARAEVAAWPWLRAGLAVALCFHLLGNATFAGVGGSLAGGAAAALVFAFPRDRWPLAVLAVAAVGLYWHEAPIVGNHLLLLAAMATVVALESFLGSGVERALAGARLSVLVFYGFAAFAKLNEGFFDPDTSCARLLPVRERPIAPSS